MYKCVADANLVLAKAGLQQKSESVTKTKQKATKKYICNKSKAQNFLQNESSTPGLR